MTRSAVARSHWPLARPFAGRLTALGLAAVAVWLAAAPPAAAKLEEPITQFKTSALVKGDSMFKFDGRIGARYRFSGATHCIFGDGLLLLDTVDGVIVQETVVLPLPTTPRERQLMETIMKTYIDDTGLSQDDGKVVMAAFEDGIQAGKSQQKDLGNPLWRKYQLNVYTNPSLRSILVMVGLKQ